MSPGRSHRSIVVPSGVCDAHGTRRRADAPGRRGLAGAGRPGARDGGGECPLRCIRCDGSGKASSDLLSVGRAAQALGVSAAIVKKWIGSGEIPATRRGSRIVVSRQDLVAYLDRIREAQKAIPTGPQADPEKIAAERDFVLAGMSSELQDRLRALMEKLEDGGQLSAEEEAELDRLEDVSARISADRLRKWTRRRQHVARNQ